ncbi:MAG: VanZ family protein [Pseudomonadota bacterium]
MAKPAPPPTESVFNDPPTGLIQVRPKAAAFALFAATLILAAAVGLAPQTTLGAPLDKSAHFFTFFLLSISAGIAWPRAGAAVALGLAALGLLGEYAQIFIDGRQADAADALFNTLGVAGASGALGVIRYAVFLRSVSGAGRARRAAVLKTL